jgi:signal transduction histidine kinase
MQDRQNLRALHDSGPVGRIAAILTARDDYETRIPIGIQGRQTPIFTIQVLVSPVLLRNDTLPLLEGLLLVSGLALVFAFLLAWWSANLALRPLEHIAHWIDDIAAGKSPETLRTLQDTQELAFIESKLSLLGERYRDARENASQLRLNLDGVLEKLDTETRRHLENQLSLARRLSAIASLTGRVAHEIKNPLNSIALRIEMLRGRMAEESPDAEPEFAILSEELTRLDRVVRTFLDFNRPVELNLENIDVAGEAADILTLMEPEAALKGIAVSSLRPAEAILVKGDAGLLRQALLNIVVNAIEAMETGGKLSIDVTNDSGSCLIAIADTGPGIPLAEREKIFQLYFTTKPRGTGVGLAMTFRAIQLHGGTIDVESEPGQGTCFRIALPLAEGTAA